MELKERLGALWENFTTNPAIMIAILVSILVFTVLYYYLIKFWVDNKATSLVLLFVMVMIIASGIMMLVKNISATLLVVPAIFIIATIILYSVEIKRLLWSRRSMKLVDLKHGDGVNYDEEKVQSCISEIIKALQNMSKNDVGAIIVLSTGNVPSQILDSGVRLDCDISSELIESIFFPKTPLHDGAMIINGTKIVAAGCFLPLTQNLDKIPKDLGTRHRAGIGVTETIDVMSLIVSEESGIISVARTGKITRYADTETLKRTLGQYYWQELESARK